MNTFTDLPICRSARRLAAPLTLALLALTSVAIPATAGTDIRGPESWNGYNYCFRIDTGWQTVSAVEGGETIARFRAGYVLLTELAELTRAMSKENRNPKHGEQTMEKCKSEGSLGQVSRCKRKFVQCYT